MSRESTVVTTDTEPVAMSNSTPSPSQHGARPDKRRRHLIDPNAPRPVRDTRAEERSLTRVQRWVMSSLAVTTILHLSVGLILAAMVLSRPTLSSEIGLNVIAGGFGVVAVAAALAIHGRRILSWWLLLGLLPTFVGLWLTLR